MKKFKVVIKEVLEKELEIEAETKEDAIKKVKTEYYDAKNPDYILTADDFTGETEFIIGEVK